MSLVGAAAAYLHDNLVLFYDSETLQIDPTHPLYGQLREANPKSVARSEVHSVKCKITPGNESVEQVRYSLYDDKLQIDMITVEQMKAVAESDRLFFRLFSCLVPINALEVRRIGSRSPVAEEYKFPEETQNKDVSFVQLLPKFFMGVLSVFQKRSGNIFTYMFYYHLNLVSAGGKERTFFLADLSSQLSDKLPTTAKEEFVIVPYANRTLTDYPQTVLYVKAEKRILVYKIDRDHDFRVWLIDEYDVAQHADDLSTMRQLRPEIWNYKYFCYTEDPARLAQRLITLPRVVEKFRIGADNENFAACSFHSNSFVLASYNPQNRVLYLAKTTFHLEEPYFFKYYKLDVHDRLAIIGLFEFHEFFLLLCGMNKEFVQPFKLYIFEPRATTLEKMRQRPAAFSDMSPHLPSHSIVSKDFNEVRVFQVTDPLIFFKVSSDMDNTKTGVVRFRKISSYYEKIKWSVQMSFDSEAVVFAEEIVKGSFAYAQLHILEEPALILKPDHLHTDLHFRFYTARDFRLTLEVEPADVFCFRHRPTRLRYNLMLANGISSWTARKARSFEKFMGEAAEREPAVLDDLMYLFNCEVRREFAFNRGVFFDCLSRDEHSYVFYDLRQKYVVFEELAKCATVSFFYAQSVFFCVEPFERTNVFYFYYFDAVALKLQRINGVVDVEVGELFKSGYAQYHPEVDREPVIFYKVQADPRQVDIRFLQLGTDLQVSLSVARTIGPVRGDTAFASLRVFHDKLLLFYETQILAVSLVLESPDGARRSRELHKINFSGDDRALTFNGEAFVVSTPPLAHPNPNEVTRRQYVAFVLRNGDRLFLCLMDPVLGSAEAVVHMQDIGLAFGAARQLMAIKKVNILIAERNTLRVGHAIAVFGRVENEKTIESSEQVDLNTYFVRVIFPTRPHYHVDFSRFSHKRSLSAEVLLWSLAKRIELNFHVVILKNDLESVGSFRKRSPVYFHLLKELSNKDSLSVDLEKKFAINFSDYFVGNFFEEAVQMSYFADNLAAMVQLSPAIAAESEWRFDAAVTRHLEESLHAVKWVPVLAEHHVVLTPRLALLMRNESVVATLPLDPYFLLPAALAPFIANTRCDHYVLPHTDILFHRCWTRTDNATAYNVFFSFFKRFFPMTIDYWDLLQMLKFESYSKIFFGNCTLVLYDDVEKPEGFSADNFRAVVYDIEARDNGTYSIAALRLLKFPSQPHHSFLSLLDGGGFANFVWNIRQGLFELYFYDQRARETARYSFSRNLMLAKYVKVSELKFRHAKVWVHGLNGFVFVETPKNFLLFHLLLPRVLRDSQVIRDKALAARLHKEALEADHDQPQARDFKISRIRNIGERSKDRLKAYSRVLRIEPSPQTETGPAGKSYDWEFNQNQIIQRNYASAQRSTKLPYNPVELPQVNLRQFRNFYNRIGEVVKLHVDSEDFMLVHQRKGQSSLLSLFSMRPNSLRAFLYRQTVPLKPLDRDATTELLEDAAPIFQRIYHETLVGFNVVPPTHKLASKDISVQLFFTDRVENVLISRARSITVKQRPFKSTELELRASGLIEDQLYRIPLAPLKASESKYATSLKLLYLFILLSIATLFGFGLSYLRRTL